MSHHFNKKRRVGELGDEEAAHTFERIGAGQPTPGIEVPSVGATAGVGGAGGGGISGNMPRTDLNNPFSGHVIVPVADNLTAPLNVNYNDVFKAIQVQHGIMNFIAPPSAGDALFLTVLNVDFYGASSGIISLTPYIQRSVPSNSEPAKMQIIGQQIVDVGTIDQKPHLSHNFGNGPENTRTVNRAAPPLPADDSANDLLFAYQIVQKATAAIPIDSGWLRISFILRRNVIIDLSAIVPQTADVLKLPQKDIDDIVEKSKHESEKIAKIEKIKKLTLPMQH